MSHHQHSWSNTYYLGIIRRCVSESEEESSMLEALLYPATFHSTELSKVCARSDIKSSVQRCVLGHLK